MASANSPAGGAAAVFADHGPANFASQIWGHAEPFTLILAPFIDVEWFELKVQPSWGYSIMTGVSIGFSRLWKPQYEKF